MNESNLRRLRPVPEPIPWYLRAGYNDHKFLEDKLAAGETRINRAVIDAAFLDRHDSLIRALQSRNAELVLDPRCGDMLGNWKGHTINARFEQLMKLGRPAESQRAGEFIRNELIPIGANLIKLDHALGQNPDVQRRIQKKRRFVDDLRLTLENLHADMQVQAPRSSIPRRMPYRLATVTQQNQKRPIP